MDLRWSLDELYPSFESEAFKADFERFAQYITRIRDWSAGSLNDTNNPKEKIEEYIKI